MWARQPSPATVGALRWALLAVLALAWHGAAQPVVVLPRELGRRAGAGSTALGGRSANRRFTAASAAGGQQQQASWDPAPEDGRAAGGPCRVVRNGNSHCHRRAETELLTAWPSPEAPDSIPGATRGVRRLEAAPPLRARPFRLQLLARPRPSTRSWCGNTSTSQPDQCVAADSCEGVAAAKPRQRACRR
jgi:hypothetical protein